MRRRRRWKRAAVAAALAASFAGGMATMWLTFRPQTVEVRVVERVIVPVPAPPTMAKSSEPEPEPEAPATGRALEWQAAENPDRRAQLLHQAGDRYLKVESDIPSAMRCYQRSVAALSETELEVIPEDTWLLKSVKIARQEEIRHAKNAG
jgi:hypothetical protein